MNPRITPSTPSHLAHATNQKMYCSAPATSVINTPTGRNEFLKGFTVPSIYARDLLLALRATVQHPLPKLTVLNLTKG